MSDPHHVVVRGPLPLPDGDQFTEVRLFNFRTGKPDLKPEHKDGLDTEVIPVVRSRRDLFFVHMIGMASQLGGAGRNLELSQKRVSNVRKYLLEQISLLRVPFAGERLRSFVGVGESESFGTINDARDRAVRIQITRSPTPLINARLPRGGETTDPPSRLQLLVANVLRDPIAQQSNFTAIRETASNVEVSGDLLGGVAFSVLRGHIDVQVNPAKVTPGAAATYSFHEDILFLGRENFNEFGRALIVHEAVHALNDKRQLPIRIDDDEAMAYVAEALYLRRSHVVISRGAQQAAAIRGDAAIILRALPIADQLIAHTTPTAADWLRLVRAIQAEPLYSDGFASQRPCDGLKRANRRRFPEQ